MRTTAPPAARRPPLGAGAGESIRILASEVLRAGARQLHDKITREHYITADATSCST
jgi:hypothetical protein